MTLLICVWVVVIYNCSLLYQGDRGPKGGQGEKGLKGSDGPAGEQVRLGLTMTTINGVGKNTNSSGSRLLITGV